MDGADSELPGYTVGRPPGYTDPPAQAAAAAATSSAAQPYRTEHKCSLENKGKHWLLIFVKSRSPSAANIPYFVEADTVSGRVELDLDKSESIKGISIQISAGATTVGQEEQVFLNLSQDLWPAPKEKSPGKVEKGKHSWPFSFTLPKKVTPADPKGLSLDAPPSFTERGSPAYIDYKIIATVKRGGFKSNQTLTTSFAYLPLTTPEPPSKLRLMAYKEGGDFPGPDGDPYGWKTLDPVTVKGKLFDAKEVTVECALSIATPLTYSIGTPIPLYLTLQSDDEQALDTVSNPEAIKLHLVRCIALGSDAMEERPLSERRSNTVFITGVGQAYFWPSTEGAREPGKRLLRGELEVKKGVKPSFVFPRFGVRYTLDLLPLSVTGFAPLDTEPGKGLVSEPVKITTRHIPGVTPRSYAPPGYEKPPESDYNAAVGYLENGNQRFYHHHGGGI